MSFSKCAIFPPQAGLKQLEFISSDGCVDKSIIALTLKKEDNMNESEAFITQLCGTKFQLLQACLRGGKVAHFVNDTASEK